MIDSHLVRSGFHFIQINLKLATFRQIDYLCPTREYSKYWQSRQYLLYLHLGMTMTMTAMHAVMTST